MAGARCRSALRCHPYNLRVAHRTRKSGDASPSPSVSIRPKPLILSGPRVGHTYRGQVYFAVALAFVIAVLVARRVTGARGIIWYLPGPLVVGIVGVLLAAVRPGLGAGYESINIIPAWGLVRPLPIEMVSVGVAAILLTLRAATRLSSEEEQA